MADRVIALFPGAQAALNASAGAGSAFTGERSAEVVGLGYHALVLLNDEQPQIKNAGTLGGLKRWLADFIEKSTEQEAYTYLFYGTLLRLGKLGKKWALVAPDFSHGVLVDDGEADVALTPAQIAAVDLLPFSGGYVGAPWFQSAVDEEEVVEDPEEAADDDDADGPGDDAVSGDEDDEDDAEGD